MFGSPQPTLIQSCEKKREKRRIYAPLNLEFPRIHDHSTKYNSLATLDHLKPLTTNLITSMM